MFLDKLKKKVIESRSKYQIENDMTSCIHCRICQTCCKYHAITVNSENKEWQWESEKCVRCNNCIRKCPKKSLKSVSNS